MQLLLYTFAHILFSTVSYFEFAELPNSLFFLFVLLIFIMWFLFNCLVLIDLSSLAGKKKREEKKIKTLANVIFMVLMPSYLWF